MGRGVHRDMGRGRLGPGGMIASRPAVAGAGGRQHLKRSDRGEGGRQVGAVCVRAPYVVGRGESDDGGRMANFRFAVEDTCGDEGANFRLEKGRV